MKHVLQVARFAAVGCTAAAVNFLAVVALVQFAQLAPLLANLFAFLLAFWVSYYGHGRFTFTNRATRARGALQRFFAVAIFSFVLNESLFYGLLSLTNLHYAAALFLVLMVVPPITFALSKWWVFR